MNLDTTYVRRPGAPACFASVLCTHVIRNVLTALFAASRCVVIKIGSERFEAPERMFQPHLVGVKQPGVAGMWPRLFM